MERRFRRTLVSVAVAASLAGAAAAQPVDDGSDALEPGDNAAAAAQPVDDGWDALERGDYAAAVEAFQADQGDVEAEYQLGAMYYEGQGVPQDYATAAQWYQKAADGGDADAQFVLGLMYSEGQGVPLDYAEAYERLNLASTLLDDADERAAAAEARDEVGELMSPEELAEARQRAGL